MRPGRLGAREATQELRSSGTSPLAGLLLHRRDPGRPLGSAPAASSHREPSPLALARPLALRLLLGARRTLPEVAGVGLRSFFFSCFFFFFYSLLFKYLPETLKGLLNEAQGFDEGHE